MLEHDPGVGGRFSVLTNVGLLPAAVLGLDIAAIRAGAGAGARAGAGEEDRRRGAGRARRRARRRAGREQGQDHRVLMAYADRLERFTRWYVQLWAESLGKDGKGTTPVGALGPVDQHSQLQLFIAGPRDKLFTVITVGSAGQGPAHRSANSRSSPASRTSAARPSAISSPRKAAPPPRRWRRTAARCAPFTLRQLDEASLGELLMHFMLETIIAAHLLGVDAFDQPAVEEGKVLAKKYLARQAERASHDPASRPTRIVASTRTELSESFVRSSGPGGQNVNKVSTAVQLRFDVRRSPSLPNDVAVRLMRLAGKRLTKDGVIVIIAQSHRKQERNRADARERLVELIREAAVRPVPRRATKVPQGPEAAADRGQKAPLRHQKPAQRQAERLNSGGSSRGFASRAADSRR